MFLRFHNDGSPCPGRKKRDARAATLDGRIGAERWQARASAGDRRMQPGCWAGIVFPNERGGARFV